MNLKQIRMECIMGKSDRELLELAAKARGGIEVDEDFGLIDPEKDTATQAWNPLTDDGDALRLAVQLGFNVQTEGCALVMCDRLPESVLVKYKGGDVFSYVRRAIVRAAAAIGEAM